MTLHDAPSPLQPQQPLTPSIDERRLRPYTSHRSPMALDLVLDANEGAVPPREVMEAIQSVTPEEIRRYPSATDAEAMLAARFSLDKARVLLTAGADDAIDRCCRVVLAPERQIILPVPTFEMISRYAQLRGADLIEVPWDHRPFPLDAILARITQHTAMIAVVSPNNPTGGVASSEALRALASAAPHALILADLAYAEFADEDLTATALDLPNVVVVRTLSKAWGLAGLRLGYALGPQRIIGWLRGAGNPYAVSSPSLAAARRVLMLDPRVIRPSVDRVRQERTMLFDALRDVGARPLPSQANFVLAAFEDAQTVHAALARQGIGVRAFPGHPLLHDRLRITCPCETAAFDRLLAAIREATCRTTVMMKGPDQ